MKDPHRVVHETPFVLVERSARLVCGWADRHIVDSRPAAFCIEAFLRSRAEQIAEGRSILIEDACRLLHQPSPKAPALDRTVDTDLCRAPRWPVLVFASYDTRTQPQERRRAPIGQQSDDEVGGVAVRVPPKPLFPQRIGPVLVLQGTEFLHLAVREPSGGEHRRLQPAPAVRRPGRSDLVLRSIDHAVLASSGEFQPSRVTPKFRYSSETNV